MTFSLAQLCFGSAGLDLMEAQRPRNQLKWLYNSFKIKKL